MRFFDFSPADLYDRNIPLSLLNKNEFSEIEEKLNEAVSFTDKVRVAEKFLNNRFQINKERYAFKRIKYCTERIENSKAIISVDLLASETFLSRRQFERIFSEYVGTSPKQFLQTIRFQHALFRKSKYPDDTLTALAYDCGYYDNTFSLMIKVMEQRFALEVLESKEPVVVEFFTEWNGSAFIITELLYALEKQYLGVVKFVIVNMDESEQLRRSYGVKKIPTILFFKDGEVVGQLEGTQPRSKIKEGIENVLNHQ